MRVDILRRQYEIINWVNSKKSKAFICKQLDCKPSTLEHYLSLFGVVYKGNQGLKGEKTSLIRKTVKEYIKNPNAKGSRIKKKLLEDKVFAKRCNRMPY